MEEKKSKCFTMIYSRITGYFQPTMQWNKGKKAEFSHRKTYNFAQADKKVKDED